MCDLYSDYPEAYEVVKAVIVVHGNRHFRIEILQDIKKQFPDEFSTRVYVENDIQTTPTCSDDVLSKDARTWSSLIAFPSVHRATPEAAMSQTLGFLRDRYKK